MTDETRDSKLEQDEEGDVEAHAFKGAPFKGANDEPGSDDEVEGHAFKGAPFKGANDEPGSDDDVEGHMKF